MAELVGEAYIRVTADTEVMRRALARQMKYSGKDDAGEYIRSFSKEVESTADARMRGANRALAKAIGDPKEFDRLAKSFDSIEDASKKWQSTLRDLSRQHKIATGDYNVFKDAILNWEAAAKDAREAQIALTKAHEEAIVVNNRETDHWKAIRMDTVWMEAKTKATLRQQVADKRLADARRKAALDEGGFFGKRAKQLDRLGVMSSRLFGKGSRNNFVNLVGSIVGGLAKVVTVPLGLMAKAVDAVFDTFMVGFKGAAEGAGFFTKVGGGFASLGSAAAGLLASWPMLLVGLAAAAGGLGLLAAILPGLVALIGLMTTAVVSLAGAISYGLVGGLLAVGPAAIGALAGLGSLFSVFQSFISDKKNKAFMDDFKKPFEDFNKSHWKEVKTFLTNVKSGFGTLFADLNPAVTGFFTSWKKNMNDPSTKKGLGAWSDSIGRIATTFNTTLPNLLSGLIGFFRPILPYAEKLATAIGNAFKTFDDWANSKPGRNAISDFMKTAWEDAKLVWDILLQIGGIVGTVFDFGEPTGSSFLKDIDGWLKGIKEKLQDPANKGKIEEWFGKAKDIGEDIGKIADGIGVAMGHLASKEGQEGAKQFLENMVKIAENAVIISDAIVAIGKVSGLGLIMNLLGGNQGPVKPVLPPSGTAGQGKEGTGTSALQVPSKTKSAIAGGVVKMDVVFTFNGKDIPAGSFQSAVESHLGLTGAQEQQLKDFVVPVMADTKEWDKTKLIVGEYLFKGKVVPVDGNETSWNAVKGTVAGYAFDAKTVQIKANTEDLSAAIANAKRWLNSLPSTKRIRIAGITQGGIPIGAAAGGYFDTPTVRTIGEAGPEAVIPLDRPLAMVDPSVRSMSAILQSLVGGRGGTSATTAPRVNFEAGAFNINLPTGDPKLAAEAVLDRLVAYIG